MTGLIGFGLVVAFMFVLYGAWGLLANLALALNVVLTFGALSLLGATLTLARHRRHRARHRPCGRRQRADQRAHPRGDAARASRAIVALDAGFKRAYSTIVDSNLTALIATALLFMFGIGPGARLCRHHGLGHRHLDVHGGLRRARHHDRHRAAAGKLKVLRIEPLFRMKLDPGRDEHLVHERARFFGIGVFGVPVDRLDRRCSSIPGLNYGVDFKGGIQMEVATSEPADLRGHAREPRSARGWARSRCRSSATARACWSAPSASPAARRRRPPRSRRSARP